ncbi:outer membrane protein oprM precursor, multidrug resistance protein [gut metagenome]|uniref:Outer membrane protein oprM, multidrug resistance protein n=1 Tax=gut metagenome TaxID=749906 RepID=J9GSD6_9ZZZZ
MCAATLLSSCHIYKAYDRPKDITTEGLYRDTVADGTVLTSDTTNFGNLPWQEVFTDLQLQALIEKALTQSPDIRTAALKVKEAKAALMSAKLAYLPALTLSPQGVVSSWDKGKASQTYSLPVNASWQIDLFGQILNPKRQAKATLEQVKAYEQNARVQLIANTANLYYTLLMLDRQLQISESSAEILKKNAETVEAMKEAGFYGTTQAAVEQSRAAYAQVQASLPDLRANIREVENTLCLLLGEPAHNIERGQLEDQQLPKEFSIGLPLQLLSNRPDVKAAEQALASAYYNTNIARSNFYPRIMLTGSAGWTNSAGSAIVNPGKLLASAVASLTQPLFQKGTNIARLKIAKAQQEEAKIQFEQVLLNAGNEVSNALYQYQTCTEKVDARTTQVTSAQNAADYTKELFNLGTSTYLEVLSAEQSHLSAQLSEVTDTFNQMQAVISLYQALGGGRME